LIEKKFRLKLRGSSYLGLAEYKNFESIVAMNSLLGKLIAKQNTKNAHQSFC